jgi:hypothetical protein
LVTSNPSQSYFISNFSSLGRFCFDRVKFECNLNFIWIKLNSRGTNLSVDVAARPRTSKLPPRLIVSLCAALHCCHGPQVSPLSPLIPLLPLPRHHAGRCPGPLLLHMPAPGVEPPPPIFFFIKCCSTQPLKVDEALDAAPFFIQTAPIEHPCLLSSPPAIHSPSPATGAQLSMPDFVKKMPPTLLAGELHPRPSPPSI